MPDADEIEDSQRRTWAACSPGWEKWDEVISDQLAPVGKAMIDSLGIAPDQHHLDVASGTGEPGLSIAALCPRGRVVMTDLSEQMLAAATRRADALDLRNVEARVCSADDLPFEDASFDSVSIRFGYMFFPDLHRATAEAARVLRAGGRLSASVWVDPDGNPWTSLALKAVASEVPLPVSAPGAPGMFRCAAPGAISSLYASAGLRDITEKEVAVSLVTASPEQYWEVMSEHVSSVVTALQDVDDATRARIGAVAAELVRPYVQDGAVRVPGSARCITGTR